MSYSLTGTLHGRTIELDQVEQSLEGLRVRVILEPIQQDRPRLSRAENERLFKEWVASGPQGPLDEEPEFP